MEKYREIERSIIKKYRKEIWSKFIKAIKDYELIQENDNIMVCISGGKDSFLLAKLIQELKRHGQIPFEAHYVVMDPGYNEKKREYIENNAKLMNIPIEIFKTDIFEVANSLNPENPCYMCARMRRGHLYNIILLLNLKRHYCVLSWLFFFCACFATMICPGVFFFIKDIISVPHVIGIQHSITKAATYLGY